MELHWLANNTMSGRRRERPSATESNINQCFYDPGYRHVHWPLILKPLPGATPNGSLLKPRSVTAPGGHLSEVEEFLTTRQDTSERAIVRSEFFTSFNDLDFLIMLLDMRVDILV